jgi:hypothetical protein
MGQARGEFSLVFIPEGCEPIAPGRAKHAPGEWRVDLEYAPWRGAKLGVLQPLPG